MFSQNKSEHNKLTQYINFISVTSNIHMINHDTLIKKNK